MGFGVDRADGSRVAVEQAEVVAVAQGDDAVADREREVFLDQLGLPDPERDRTYSSGVGMGAESRRSGRL